MHSLSIVDLHNRHMVTMHKRHLRLLYVKCGFFNEKGSVTVHKCPVLFWISIIMRSAAAVYKIYSGQLISPECFACVFTGQKGDQL